MRADSIGLLLQRSINPLPRETLDWPLALLSLDWRVQVFLSGPVLVQLPRRLEVAASANTLPVEQHENWSRLWLAATELGAELCISTPDLQRWGLDVEALAVPVTILTPAQIRARQAQCRHLLHV